MTWTAVPPPRDNGDGGPLASGLVTETASVGVSHRNADGTWSQPEVLPADNQGLPSVAVNDEGETALAWNHRDLLWTTYSATSSGFSSPRSVQLPHGPYSSQNVPMVIDDHGTAVLARSSGDGQQDPTTFIFGVTRDRDREFDAPVALSDPSSRWQTRPVIARDRWGNGVVLWGEPGRVMSASFSSAPPALLRLRVTRSAVTLWTNEPGRVSLRLRTRTSSRRAQIGVAHRGRNRLALSRALGRWVTHHRKLRATVRIIDAGPGASTRTVQLG